jgi:protein-disulfide isomerase-like protein with CxxC motif
MGSKHKTTNISADVIVVPVGVPRDQAKADRIQALYEAIDTGTHDDRLDAIERMAKSRRTYDRRALHRQAPTPAGLDTADLIVQIQHGYYSDGRDSMDLILEAVRARKVHHRNQALTAKLAELAAAKPELAAGDRVWVRLDAPANQPSMILVGKAGTVERVLQARAAVAFDDSQALGKFAGQATVKIPIAWLEPLPERSDPGALDAIAAILNKDTWDSGDDFNRIADLVRGTGRAVG